MSRVIAERYWPVARASLSPTSQNRDGYILETFISELGNLRLCDIRPISWKPGGRANLAELRVKDVDWEWDFITFPMMKNGTSPRVPLLPELKQALIEVSTSLPG